MPIKRDATPLSAGAMAELVRRNGFASPQQMESAIRVGVALKRNVDPRAAIREMQTHYRIIPLPVFASYVQEVLGDADKPPIARYRDFVRVLGFMNDFATADAVVNRYDVIEHADAVEAKLAARDLAVDKGRGIDTKLRESIKADPLPPALRDDVRKAFEQHHPAPKGPQSNHDTRELLAQGHEHLARRIGGAIARDEANRDDPFRAEKTLRDDVKLAFDKTALEEMTESQLDADRDGLSDIAEADSLGAFDDTPQEA